jgi:DNA-binding winged helix-turn-helix (wHTH) protein
MKAGEVFQFGEFQIDARARTLRREEKIVTLQLSGLRCAGVLCTKPGRTLTRDELRKNVWPDTYVDEHSLAQSISVVRRALDEKPGDNSYIVTLPGRGNQFVAPVRVVSQESLAIVPDAATSAGDHPHCRPAVCEAVVAAAATPPKRRCRRLNSARAASRSVASKSGHIRSVNRSSA